MPYSLSVTSITYNEVPRCIISFIRSFEFLIILEFTTNFTNSSYHGDYSCCYQKNQIAMLLVVLLLFQAH